MTTYADHDELVRIAERWLTRDSAPSDSILRGLLGHEMGERIPYDSRAAFRACSFAMVEAPGTGEEPDAIGFFGGHWTQVVECKASRADFMADRKKFHRRHGASGMGYYRWFLTPKGLVRPEELPEKWGLLESLGGKRVRCVRIAQPWPERNERAEMEVLVTYLRLMFATLRGSRIRDTRRARRLVELLSRTLDRGLPTLEQGSGLAVTGWAEYAHNGTGDRSWAVHPLGYIPEPKA